MPRHDDLLRIARAYDSDPVRSDDPLEDNCDGVLQRAPFRPGAVDQVCDHLRVGLAPEGDALRREIVPQPACILDDPVVDDRDGAVR